ncbi:hypothetical protein [Shewanella morhuae]|uniref:Uncharacterized protein n=1 Tax=Shewanella morhuae TaxID=365591 RepID=A0A380C7I9_9GAMM|nr:hypothetical protein [Shewanella morhuae]SUJ13370.1 Uncharacterised protein [Shewanella morhuae]
MIVETDLDFSSGGSLRNQRQFLSSGSFTVPDGVTKLYITACGGGAGGTQYSGGYRAGTPGGDTSFGEIITCHGGVTGSSLSHEGGGVTAPDTCLDYAFNGGSTNKAGIPGGGSGQRKGGLGGDRGGGGGASALADGGDGFMNHNYLPIKPVKSGFGAGGGGGGTGIAQVQQVIMPAAAQVLVLSLCSIDVTPGDTHLVTIGAGGVAAFYNGSYVAGHGGDGMLIVRWRVCK